MITNLHARWAAQQGEKMIGDAAEQEKQQSYQKAYLDMVERYEKLALRCIEAERELNACYRGNKELAEDRDEWRRSSEKSHREMITWKASAEKAAKLVQVPEGAAIADIIKWLEGKGYRVSK